MCICLHDKNTIIYTYSPSCLDEKIENTLLTLVALMAQISFKNLVVAIATLEKIQVHVFVKFKPENSHFWFTLTGPLFTSYRRTGKKRKSFQLSS